MLKISTFLTAIAIITQCHCCQLEEGEHVGFSPGSLNHIKEGSSQIVQWCTSLIGAHHITCKIEDEDVATVTEISENYLYANKTSNVTAFGYLNVSAHFLGITELNVTISNEDCEVLGSSETQISVVLHYERLNRIFTYMISVLLFIIYVNMGATLDMQVVKGIAKKPIGPLIGILCQYVLMPLFAFGLAKIFFGTDPLRQLGMFLSGASPGGGMSNTWTYLLGGSLDLSIMMTFCSTVASFGAVPFWVMTLGPQVFSLEEGKGFEIPYGQIAVMTISLVGPCLLGISIQRFFPQVAEFMKKYVLPSVAVFNTLFALTFGIFTHRYVFAFFNWKVLLASIALPCLGYLSGFLASWLARRAQNEIIAIAIEVGVQNTNIPVIILKFTLSSPASDLAVVMPACIIMMTPIPPLCTFLLKKLRELMQGRKEKALGSKIEKSHKVEELQYRIRFENGQVPRTEKRLNDRAKNITLYHEEGVLNEAYTVDEKIKVRHIKA